MASPNTSTSFNQTLGPVTQTLSGDVWDIGQIAQTLPSVYMDPIWNTASSMIQTVEVTVAAGEVLLVTWDELVTTTGFASDFGQANLSDSITATATASSSTPVSDAYFVLSGVVAASESLAGSQQTSTLVNTAKASSSAYSTRSAELTDAVGALGNVAGDTRTFLLQETATATEVTTPNLTVTVLYSGEATASDSQDNATAESLTSTITAVDTITPYASPTETLEEVASAVDTPINFVSYTALLEESATGTSSFDTQGSTSNEVLTSTINASDWLYARDLETIAWVMNTQTSGLTNYSNFEFRSMAYHNGKLYGTSAGGLYEVSGDTDDGRAIESVIKSGFLDFGTEQKKRVSDLYIGYTGGDLECDVETYDGPEDVYTYELQERDADAPRNNRLKVGRGLSSRYWRLTFRNLGGADFQIHDVAVNVARSKRRL